MRSTGEVLGLAENFPLAFYKSQVGSGTACGAKTVRWTVFSESPSSCAAKAAGSELPHAPAAWENKKVLISLSNKEGQKDQVLEIGKTLKNLGFTHWLEPRAPQTSTTQTASSAKLLTRSAPAARTLWT